MIPSLIILFAFIAALLYLVIEQRRDIHRLSSENARYRVIIDAIEPERQKEALAKAAKNSPKSVVKSDKADNKESEGNTTQ